MAIKIALIRSKQAERELAERAARLVPEGPPVQFTPVERAIHFLRGVNSLAQMALPAFYLFLGSKTTGDDTGLIKGYPGIVLNRALAFSSLNTLSLATRKTFDHRKDVLSAKTFGQHSDGTMSEVAEYWSNRSKQPRSDAYAALCLLRAIFNDCAKSNADLLRSTSTLCRRIALMKQHADRSAAHLSLERYEFTTLDCAHVIAALSVIGEIIGSFDEPAPDPTFFDVLDASSFSATRKLFPSIADIRLFDQISVATQACDCWEAGIDEGRRMLYEQLPYETGWY